MTNITFLKQAMGTAATGTMFRLSCALALLATCASASRILIYASPGCYTHHRGLQALGQETAARGHDVLFVLEKTDADRLNTNLPLLTYKLLPKEVTTVAAPAVQTVTQPENEGYRIPPGTSFADFLAGMMPLTEHACHSLMRDADAMKAMRDFAPDLLIGEPWYQCTPLLTWKLSSVPWVSYWAVGIVEPLATSLSASSPLRLFAPNPLSYHPQVDMRITTQYMTFAQRVLNVAKFWSSHYFADYRVMQKTQQRLFAAYGFDITSAADSASPVLTISPLHWAAEWLRPVSPDFKMVGPIMAGPGKPLPHQFEDYMQSAGKQGVLLVALGHMAQQSLRDRIAMAAALSRLPVKVLWRLLPSEVPDAAALAQLGLGNNTKVVTQMPQNDLLAHPQTRAFVFQGGIYSQYEAVYHGKPVIVMPFFADQPPNADRVVAKGYGVRVDPKQAGTPAFEAAVLEVLTDPKYGQAARALSVRVRARKNTPLQEAGDWIEHVLETGGVPYLHTPASKLNIFVRHSLDTYGFLLGCAGALLYLAWRLAALGSFLLAEKPKLA